jgi:aryl-alcohol dehydrogenase-like predicted oxidoreductase
MEYRAIGRTDLQVSELCLGTMTFGWGADKETSFAIMDRAVEGGINFFDTADIYSNWIEGNPGGVAEAWIGDWLADRKPDGIVIATKVRGRMWDGSDGEGLSRAHIMRGVEESLRRLQIEQIDLYQTHWPDDDTSLDETLRALDDLIQQGKVRFVGCSNHSADLLKEALRISTEGGLARYESLQPHYSLVKREEFERELLALCEQESIGVIPYSPLGRGFLTGKYRRNQGAPGGSRGATRADDEIHKFANERNFALLDQMEAMGKERGATIAQIALAWQLTQPVIASPIVGATKVAQLEESLGAVGLRLNEEEMQALDEASSWR